MNFCRDLILRSTSLRLYGVVHQKSLNGPGSALATLHDLKKFNPDLFLVETGRKSLDLTQFVWDTRDSSVTPESFCQDESDLVETAAVAANGSMGSARVIPIDVEPIRTRGRLARSALVHPWESLVLISRYNRGSASISSLEEAGAWREDFASACPHAFRILFTDRESHMRDRILEEIFSCQPRNAAVLVGVSHVDALYDLLVSYATRPDTYSRCAVGCGDILSVLFTLSTWAGTVST